MKYLISYSCSYWNGEYYEVNKHYIEIFDERDLDNNIEKLKDDGRIHKNTIKVFKTEELFDF